VPLGAAPVPGAALLEEPVVLAPELGATTFVMAPTFWLIVISCSSELNCASSPTNCVLSVGLSGSWFLSCATSSVKKVPSFADTPLREFALPELELELLEEEVTGFTCV